MSTSFLPTWLYSDQKIFELELENCEKYKKDPNEDNKKLVKTSLNRAFSLIDKAVKKNVLHKNNGANRKSKINNFVKTTLTTK